MQTAATTRITNWQPRKDAVLVQPHKEETTASGIILADRTKNNPKPCYATVIAVGSDLSADISVNDTLLIKSWGGSKVELDGHNLQIVKLDDIFGIITID